MNNFQPSQRVQCSVLSVDPERNQLNLTLVKPREVKPGRVLLARISKVEDES